jgi:hypothetical protein
MPEPKVYAFSQHIGALCVTRDTNLHKLGAKLGIDPMELLRMINGTVRRPRRSSPGLAKELDAALGI